MFPHVIDLHDYMIAIGCEIHIIYIYIYIYRYKNIFTACWLVPPILVFHLIWVTFNSKLQIGKRFVNRFWKLASHNSNYVD